VRETIPEFGGHTYREKFLKAAVKANLFTAREKLMQRRPVAAMTDVPAW
jgi:hypothetical protein